MRVIGRPKLEDFVKRHSEASGSVLSWLREVEAAKWTMARSVKESYPLVDFMDDKYIFKLMKSHYYLQTRINFDARIILIEQVNTFELPTLFDFEEN